jgi:hypothetical protein
LAVQLLANNGSLQIDGLQVGGLYVLTKYQQRKGDDAADPKVGLARRATDTSLRGLHIDEADGDEAWQSWQEALKRQEEESVPTEPAALE